MEIATVTGEAKERGYTHVAIFDTDDPKESHALGVFSRAYLGHPPIIKWDDQRYRIEHVQVSDMFGVSAYYLRALDTDQEPRSQEQRIADLFEEVLEKYQESELAVINEYGGNEEELGAEVKDYYTRFHDLMKDLMEVTSVERADLEYDRYIKASMPR